jgi:hypothetical protein
MTTVGLCVRLEARPGKEDDVADLLRRHPMRLGCQAAWGSFLMVLGKAVSSS